MASRRSRNWFVVAVISLFCIQTVPAHAESAEELDQQLEAQREINVQLRGRILELEETVERLEQADAANADIEDLQSDAVPGLRTTVTPGFDGVVTGAIVQVSAHRDREEAAAAVEVLQSTHTEFLRGRPVTIQEDELGSDDTRYRVRVGPFATDAEAEATCMQLRTEGSDCFVVVLQSQQSIAGLPADDVLDESDLDALEQALVQQGSSLLPPWRAQLVPGASWTHSGSSAFRSESNSYVTGLSARMGLPLGMMAGLSVPYSVRTETPSGDNNGFRDLSVTVWKQLLARTRTRPSLIAGLGYTIPTGDDPFETEVPLGSGFHVLRGTLSTVKTVDPVAFYADLSYAYPFRRMVDGNRLQPGNAIGLRFGSTLAATPEIALNLGLNFTFVGRNETNGVAITGTDRSIGTLDVGAGIILRERTYLSISGRLGVTDDAPDIGVSIAMPTRF